MLPPSVRATFPLVPKYVLRRLETPALKITLIRRATPTELAQPQPAAAQCLLRRYFLVRFDPPFDYFLI